MSDESGSASHKFHAHMVIEIALIVALALYMVLAGEQAVGDNLTFTVTGAALMALVSFWTLHTIRDALEVVVVRVRRFRH